MLPLNSKCVVRNRGLGTIEAVCNDKHTTGVCYSYLVRLVKEPQRLYWFEWDQVQQYDGPEERQPQRRSSSEEDQSEGVVSRRNRISQRG